jgi:TolB-like protein/Flp pilus assembly protein TadD
LTEISVPLSTKRIAVVPFRNISPEKNENEYFADGMTEEIITAISNLHELSVIASTSTIKYKDTKKSAGEIGRELGVGTILEGSVRKIGRKVRVTAQLIDATSEAHVWAESYDRSAEDIFSIQSEIAERVARSLRVRILAVEKERLEKKATTSNSAYIKYLKGRYLQRGRTSSDLKLAKSCFESALVSDPKFALAYTGLADAYCTLGKYSVMPADLAIQKAHEALAKALIIDDDLSETHTSMGFLLLSEYRFREAEEEIRRALALNPNNGLAHHFYCVLLADIGRMRESLAEVTLVQEGDPLSYTAAINCSILAKVFGDDEGAARYIDILRSLEPGEHWVDFALAHQYAIESNFKEAAKHYRAYVDWRPDDLERVGELGYVLGRIGRVDEARNILNQLLETSKKEKKSSSFALALVHRGLGNLDEFFRCMNHAIAEYSLEFRIIRFLHVDDGIKNDPRYISILRNLKLLPGERREETFGKEKSTPGLSARKEKSEPPFAEAPLQGPASIPTFSSSKAKQAFDFLVKAFLQDQVAEGIPIYGSGWRTLAQISDGTDIPRGFLYASAEYQKENVLNELKESNAVETKVFTGERGRGGSVTRIRVAYETNEKIKEYVGAIAREKTRIISWQ